MGEGVGAALERASPPPNRTRRTPPRGGQWRAGGRRTAYPNPLRGTRPRQPTLLRRARFGHDGEQAARNGYDAAVLTRAVTVPGPTRGRLPCPRRTAPTPGEWRDSLEETLEGFDETGGHRVLSRVFDELGVEDALSLVVLPYLHDVGERWSAGSIGVAQEHFASHVLRSRLAVLMETDERSDGPLAVLACAPRAPRVRAHGHTRSSWRASVAHELPRRQHPDGQLARTCRMLRPAAVVVAAHRSTAFAAHAPALRRLAGSTRVHLAAQGATDEIAELCGASRLDGDPGGQPAPSTRPTDGPPRTSPSRPPSDGDATADGQANPAPNRRGDRLVCHAQPP